MHQKQQHGLGKIVEEVKIDRAKVANTGTSVDLAGST